MREIGLALLGCKDELSAERTTKQLLYDENESLRKTLEAHSLLDTAKFPPQQQQQQQQHQQQQQQQPNSHYALCNDNQCRTTQKRKKAVPKSATIKVERVVKNRYFSGICTEYLIKA